MSAMYTPNNRFHGLVIVLILNLYAVSGKSINLKSWASSYGHSITGLHEIVGILLFLLNTESRIVAVGKMLMCSYKNFIDRACQSIATCRYGTLQGGKNKNQAIWNEEKVQTYCSSIDQKIQNNLQEQQ